MDIPLVVCYAGLLHQSSKNKKNPPRKNFLIFREIKIFDSKIKKCIIFFQKKAFLVFPEMQPCTFRSKIENKKIYPEKISYILILKNLLYFLKRKLYLYFRKPKLRKNFLYFLKRKLFLYFKKWKRLKLFVFQ